MKCPKCGTEENIKWFLRHQQENEEDTSDAANVITILCTDCGNNESHFLADCLDNIFSSWSDKSLNNFGMMNGLFNIGGPAKEFEVDFDTTDPEEEL